MKYIFVIVIVFGLNAQSTLNPNISLIGDVRMQHFKNDDGKDTDFKFQGIEMVIESYLNPYSKAWTTIHFSDDEKVDIEEAYLTIIKGLPFNSQIRFGRYFLPFGEIQQKHIHTFSFMDYPSLHQAYFGEEGTRNIGLEWNFAFPVFNQFSELKLNLLEGKLTADGHAHTDEHEEHEEEDGHEEELHENLALGIYYSLFTELTEHSNLKYSFSYIRGSLDQSYEQDINIAAIAMKYKWQESDYTYFEILAEYFMNDRHIEEEHHDEEESLKMLEEEEHELENITNDGFFLAMNYQFNLAHNLGFSYSQYKNPTEFGSIDYKDVSFFTGYAPFEESLLFRFKFNRDLNLDYNTFQLQAIFSLGPHKAHQF